MAYGDPSSLICRRRRAAATEARLEAATDRCNSLSKALAAAHADADAAASAARSREAELRQQAAEELAAAIADEREKVWTGVTVLPRRPHLHTTPFLRMMSLQAASALSSSLAAAVSDGRASVAAVEARLSAESAAHATTRSELDETKRELAAATREGEREARAHADTSDALLGVRTEVVSLNSRVAALNSLLETRSEELSEARDRAAGLQTALDETAAAGAAAAAGASCRLHAPALFRTTCVLLSARSRCDL